VLASSVFNGMEGIETGGAELGDIEVGGTGAGLIGQDGQDGQDGQGVGITSSRAYSAYGSAVRLRTAREALYSP
jgi:hypothetical protein